MKYAKPERDLSGLHFRERMWRPRAPSHVFPNPSIIATKPARALFTVPAGPLILKKYGDPLVSTIAPSSIQPFFEPSFVAP